MSKQHPLFVYRALAFGTLAAISSVPVQAAVAIPEFPICDYCSHVLDEVINNNDGTWTYNFVVYNDGLDAYGYGYAGTQVIIDWELPYFADSGITNIQSAYGWNYAIETIGVVNGDTGWNGVANWQDPSDDWYQGPNSPFTTGTQVLHWYTNGSAFGIFPGGSLGGFSFTSPFAATNAPYQASWLDLQIFTGDPAFPEGGAGGIPASPQALGAVPLPAPIVLLASAMAGLASRLRPRRT